MSAIEYYDHSTFPSQGAAGSSAAMRAELETIEAAFGKLPTLAGNGGKLAAINAGGTGIEAIVTTGTGSGVRATSPTLVTPTIGEANFTSVGAYAVTFTFTGITGVTFPTTGTLATLAGAETLTNKTLTSPVINSPTGITAAAISNTPAGSIAATTVQGAIDELASEKVATTAVIAIAQGGTGAITAQNARSALGAAVAGANNDITLLTALIVGGLPGAVILGTVSQTAGVPTGAIVERGSNANGAYMRWADGTQICTHTITAAGAINNAEGSVFVTPDTTWTFPAAFVSTIPVVSGSGASTVGGVWLAAGNADRSLTAAPIKLVRSTTSGSTPVFTVMAAGRWF